MNESPTFSEFSTNDLVVAREFHGIILGLDIDAAGNILSVLST